MVENTINKNDKTIAIQNIGKFLEEGHLESALKVKSESNLTDLDVKPIVLENIEKFLEEGYKNSAFEAISAFNINDSDVKLVALEAVKKLSEEGYQLRASDIVSSFHLEPELAKSSELENIPKISLNSGAAVLLPLIRNSNGDIKSIQSLSERTKEDILALMTVQSMRVQKLAEEYGKTGSESIRREINTENLHLHGEIGVFSIAFGKEDAAKMSKLQDATNIAIENAAKIRNNSVSYVNINEIKSSDDKTASQHIQEKLFHPDNTKDFDKFMDSVEKDVLNQLHDKGYEEEDFMRKLFDLKYQARNIESANEKNEAAQINPNPTENKEDVNLKSNNPNNTENTQGVVS
jgi:hypothetical protein